jgi:hypothetical protein
MINSFLYSFTNYFENRLLTNNLIIIRNYGDDEEDERNIKRIQERQRDAHIKWRLNQIRNSRVLLGVQLKVYSRQKDEITFPVAPVPALWQNTKVETRTNEERRRAKLTSPTLRHTLQRNRRRTFARVTHVTI